MGGGQDRIGTASGSQLLIPVGARDMALGGATVANTNGVEAIGWNPAGVVMMKNRSEAIFSYLNYFAGMGVSFSGVAVNLGYIGYMGFSLKALHVGEIEKTTADLPDGTGCLLYTSPSPRDGLLSRMPSSA